MSRRRKQHAAVADDSSSDDSSDDDSVQSDATYMVSLNTTAATVDFVEGTDLREQVLDALDKVSEKRQVTREKGIKTFTSLLSTNLCQEILEDRVTTAAFKFLGVMRKSKSSDAVLSARALEVLAITMGPDNEALYTDCAKILKPIVKTGRKVAIRTAAIRALATVCFVASVEENTTIECMDLFHSIIEAAAESMDSETQKKRKKKDDSPCVEAALKAWGLLATTRSATYLGSKGFEMNAPLLCSLLEHNSYDVRCAAGQNAALLAQHYSNSDDDDEEDDDEHVEHIEYGDKTSKEVLAAMKELLKEMSVENSRHKAKKERKQQRSFFRAICKTLESGEAPEMKMVLGRETLVLNSWAQVKRLEAFRATLGNGLKVFLSANTMLRDVFDLGPVRNKAVEKLSKVEKRLYRSPNSDISKARTIDRARDRKLKNARRGMF